eukprot:4833634-Amphidinium_carterae.2
MNPNLTQKLIPMSNGYSNSFRMRSIVDDSFGSSPGGHKTANGSRKQAGFTVILKGLPCTVGV